MRASVVVQLWLTGLFAPRDVGSGAVTEPMSPALAGGFFTTKPRGKPLKRFLTE